MSKDKIQLLSPLFLKYQADYEKNPRSRVFAPLAEIYRKLGMTDKAMEILSQGIRFHPTYVMGYLGLAFCYYDLKQFALAYSTIRPLVETSRDNIRLQKIFGDICIELGYKDEALDTYKYLLFINPRDKEVALNVSNLERLFEDQSRPTHQPIFIPDSVFKTDSKSEIQSGSETQQLFDIDKLENRPNANNNDFDDWMALDLSREKKSTKVEDPYEFWNLKKGDGILNLNQIEAKAEASISLPIDIIKTSERELINQPHVELDFYNEEDEDEKNDSVIKEMPLVTHTLVDLYCGQGHIEKALEILEKILILNPQDIKTIQKISEIKSLMGPYQAAEEAYPVEHVIHEFKPKSHQGELQNISEEDGRKNLMDIFDQKIAHVEIEQLPDKTSSVEGIAPKAKAEPEASAKFDKNHQIEEKYNKFLKKIQKRALDYQARS